MTNTLFPIETNSPAVGMQNRPPWQQLRLIRESQRKSGSREIPFPVVELRGERARLQALRAEELNAWNAAPSDETSRFIRRQLGT